MNTYQVTRTLITVVEFSDEDMIKNGYEMPIFEEDRQEYLKNILADNDNWDCYDEEIKKIGVGK
jgi:hypothetical protein